MKTITLFKVTQGHRSRYQSKARMRLPISSVTAEALRAIIGSKSTILPQRGPVDPTFLVGVAPSNHFFSEN